MRNIIIDGDPGHDDAIAFLVALGNRDKLNILGFTTVAGNADVNHTTANILKIMDIMDIHVPVAKGYNEPLCRPLNNASKFHGETGLDGCLSYPDAHTKPLKMHAIEFLKETISMNKVTIVTMGPLTNIAIFLKTYPELKKNIDEIIMMGGSVHTGNALAKAEFNMYCDPEAAKIVFDSGVHLVLATIEACYAGGVLLTEQKTLKNGGKASKLAYDILKYYSRYAINNGWDRTAIFDMTTIIYLLAPEIFKAEEMRVDIETDGVYTRGMTVCDDRGPTYIGKPDNPKTVITGVDRDKLVKIMFESLARLDKRIA